MLRIDQVIIDNNSAAAIRADVRVLNPADLALLTVVASSNMNDMRAPIQTDGSIARTGSIVSAVTHTVLLGNVLARQNVGANDSKVLTLGVPFYVDGSAKGGVGALVVWNLADDEPIAASWIGREYVHRA